MCFTFWAKAFVNVFHRYSTNIVHLHKSHKRLTVVGVWLHSLPHTPQTNKGVFAWGIICQMKTASCALSLRQLNCRFKVMYWCCDYRFCFICAVISTFLTRLSEAGATWCSQSQERFAFTWSINFSLNPNTHTFPWCVKTKKSQLNRSYITICPYTW